MKIVIAPDKFKGSLTAREVCNAVEKGIRKVVSDAEIVSHPLGDGGEGTTDILADHLSLNKKRMIVNDPLFRPVETSYFYRDRVAYIELSGQSGLLLLNSDERNVLKTSTYGTGEVIADAYRSGYKTIWLMIGGSATNDAGAGILNAMGFEFYGDKKDLLAPTGENLSGIREISVRNRLQTPELRLIILCDVDNPFYGINGAAYVYGKQKGISSEDDLILLDRGLKNFSNITLQTMGVDLQKVPGSGAAGGVGGGLHAYLQGEIMPGTAAVMNLTRFYDKAIDADLVITGEGKLDEQTKNGKVVHGVTEFCRQNKIAAGIVCGLCESAEYNSIDNIYGPFAIKNKNVSNKTAMKEASSLLVERAASLMRKFISDRTDL